MTLPPVAPSFLCTKHAVFIRFLHSYSWCRIHKYDPIRFAFRQNATTSTAANARESDPIQHVVISTASSAAITPSQASSTTPRKTRRRKAKDDESKNDTTTIIKKPPRVPNGHWNDINNHRAFFDKIAQDLGIKQPDDWYQVTLMDVWSRGGVGLMYHYYGNSMMRALKAIYPEHEWHDMNRPKVPAGFWQDKANHRLFLDQIAREMGIHPEDHEGWYRVTIKDIRDRGGGSLLAYYSNSILRMLQSSYPEHPWDPSKFPKVPRGYWRDVDNQRRFFESVAPELGVEKLDDWYNVTMNQVRAKPRSAFIERYYNGSLMQALKAAYPEHPWREPSMPRVPKNHWKDPENQRLFFDGIAKDLGIQTLDDWYRVTIEDVTARGGTSILQQYYNSSLANALIAVYPEHDWDLARFKRVPRGYWQIPGKQREFFDRIGKELGVVEMEDWYSITREQVKAKGGAGLLALLYGNSLARALEATYPEHKWDVSRFSNVPRGFWRDLRNQRAFFDKVGKELGVKQLDDWYNVNRTEVAKRGGSGLLMDYYNNSLERALMALYPEHPWRPWKMVHQTLSDQDLKEYIEALGAALDVRHLDDWYRVSKNQIRRFGGWVHISRAGGLPLLLRRLYPEHPWDETKFSSRRTSQRLLLQRVKQLFPNAEILEEFLHPDMSFNETSQKMELDIYVPSLDLAFEYHGQQHFKDVHFFGASGKFYVKQDAEKLEACRSKGITLITVPYWWDGTVESIASTLHLVRPDLVPEPPAGAKPIPLSSPASSGRAGPSNKQKEETDVDAEEEETK